MLLNAPKHLCVEEKKRRLEPDGGKREAFAREIRSTCYPYFNAWSLISRELEVIFIDLQRIRDIIYGFQEKLLANDKVSCFLSRSWVPQFKVLTSMGYMDRFI